MDENEVLVLKGDNVTLSTGVNVDHEKNLGNCLYNGIDIYIYIYIL